MQADQLCVGRRLMLLWLSFILILIPLTPLQAQIVSPQPESDTEISSSPGAPDPALSDEEAIRTTVDALLDAQVDKLIDQMAVEDKVGQLFLIHFAGNDTSINSDIAVLIHAYRVGGVVLSPQQRNFTNQRGVDTPVEVASLANRLQALAYGLLLPDVISVVDEVNVPLVIENLPMLSDEEVEADRPAMNIPLFIAVEQLGDDLNVTSLRRDFTELPNQMTLGAAWDPDQAQEIGKIVGQELSAVGVNLLLGPSLDMLIQPRTDSVGKLGIHMYGGSPYWVSEMGRGYIAGIHEGSDDKLLTVVRHFPGQGDVDRLPDQEVATIQGDMEELRGTTLVPFEAVTDGEPSDPAVTDMLMSSNMRFSGVQGTGPERIPPLGLAPNLTSLLNEEGFDPWLESGLIVSNSLGVPAIRRFYETDDGQYPARQVAQEAFGAGNDILYLGHSAEGDEWETERFNIESTISFFQGRYEKDDVFADQVDAAVHRILKTKLRLNADMEAYEAEAISLLTEAASEQDGSETTAAEVDATEIEATPESGSASSPNFTDAEFVEPLIPLDSLLISNERLAILNEESDHRTEADAMVRQVARDSLTILFPDINEPSESSPQPPQSDDKIVIFTDSRLEQECSDCTAEVAIGPDDIENIILLLYGPDATAQIAPEQLTSLTFSELVEVLDSSAIVDEETEGAETPSPLLPTPTAETPAAAESEIGLAVLEADESAESPDLTAQIEQDIDEATWLIFAMLDVDPAYYSSDAVKRFLRERGDQLEGKKVVVLALQAPYFLDATEISALSNYLGVYSKSASFLENAVRAIFRSYTPYGSPPVSVPGTRFADLEERLQPDPLQVIDLLVQVDETDLPAVDAEGGADAQPSVPIGSTIRIQVGPVMDKNGQTVPDNTLVEYHLVYEGEELALNVEPANTHDGFAIRDVLLDRSGDLQISASSNEATTGDAYSLLVTESAAVSGNGVSGDGVSNGGVSAGDGTAESIDASSTVTATESAGQGAGEGTSSNLALPEERVNLATLIVALLALVVTASLLLIVQIRVLPRTTLVHNLLWTTIVGLAAYIIYGVGLLPGANWLYSYFGVIAAGIVVLVSMIATMLWLQLRSN